MTDLQQSQPLPWVQRKGWQKTDQFSYGNKAFAWATASVSAFCGSTLLNSACCTASSAIWLTSALCGIVGTMSAYLETISFAMGLALSSTATGLAEKNGSS